MNIQSYDSSVNCTGTDTSTESAASIGIQYVLFRVKSGQKRRGISRSFQLMDTERRNEKWHDGVVWQTMDFVQETLRQPPSLLTALVVG